MIPFILGALAAVGLSELSKRNKPKMVDGGGVDISKLTHEEFVKLAKEKGFKNTGEASNSLGYRYNGEYWVDKRNVPYKKLKYATGGALSDVGKMIKEQVKDTKDLSEKYSSKEKRKDLLKFKKSALKEYGKDIGGLYVKNIKRKAKFLADHPEILVGKVF
jgi:hypothetical protein